MKPVRQKTEVCQISKYDLEFERDLIQIRLSAAIEKEMNLQGLNKKDLADRIGTSQSYITQLFNYDKRFNIETLAKIQNALSKKFDFELKEVILPKNDLPSLLYIRAESTEMKLTQTLDETTASITNSWTITQEVMTVVINPNVKLKKTLS